MNGWRYALLKLLLLADVTLGHAAAAEPLRVTASLEGSHSSGYAISFKLENVGAGPLVIRNRNLPWTQSATSGLVVSAASSEHGGRLLRTGRSLHNPAGEVSLQEKQTIQGELQLDRVIPDLRQALEQYDVMIHWTYFPEVAGAALSPQGGSFAIRASK